MKNAPKVTDYGPTYVVSGETDRPGFQDVTVSGVLLGAGRPALRMQGANCTLETKIDTSVKFSCPSNNWSAANKVAIVSGDLTLYEKPGFFGSLFGKRPAPATYKISVSVVPKMLGRYSVTATVTTMITTPHNRSQPYDDKNSHCSGGHDREFTFNVQDPTWVIDQQSIQPNCNASNSSTCQGVADVTTKSFGIRGHIENSGTCGPKLPFSSSHSWYDAQMAPRPG